MTNKENFQKTFSKLHASPDILKEVLDMTTNDNAVYAKKKKITVKAVAVAASVILVIGSCSVAYAMDVGGVQRIVQVWIHGEQTDAEITIENGTYDLNYKDAKGKDVHQSGGGVAFDQDGNERPLTEEELLEEINAPEVSYEEDGRVLVYYFNQKIDITDKFKNGICYVRLNVNGETMYLTVKYENGYAMSPHGYIQPYEFN